MSEKHKKQVSGALAFIFLMGIVSLFSDMTHEGGRSVLGEYLNLTGASAATIGFISGLGELLGYGLRIISGRIADKTKHYWTLVIFGYVIQVLAIPALALVPENGWIVACGLVIIERVGKAVKKPAKNTLVSFASSEIGQGKGFAYQEFLDQLGAFLGPVILFIISVIKGTGNLISTYRVCFLFLGIPALITIALVLFSKYKYPHPEMFEKEEEENIKFEFKKSFVFYMIAISLFAFGFGIFETGFGIFWFLGSWCMGALYDINIPVMVTVSVAVQLMAIVFYGISIGTEKKKPENG